MSEKHYECSKILNSYLEEKERLISEYGEKPMMAKELISYIIAISADFINSYLAFMMLLDGEPVASMILAGIFAYMIGWWVPHKAGVMIKDSMTRNLPYFRLGGWSLVATAIVSIAGITVIRLFNLDTKNTVFAVAGIGGDNAISISSMALAIVLTCVMVVTFIISLFGAIDRRNYYRPLYLSKALALIDEQEKNARYHATIAEMNDEDNRPELVMEETMKQKESVLNTIESFAVLYKAHARARLEIFLSDPEKTTAIMSSKVQYLKEK